MKCEYGCGQEATHKFKLSGKWCCSTHVNKCPAVRSVMSKNSWNKGKKNCYSTETLERMSENHKGKDTWNKGKTGCFSDETLNKMSNSLKGREISEKTRTAVSNAHKGIPKSNESNLKRSKSLKGRIISDEAKKKIREYNLGKKRTIQSRIKQSLSMQGKNHPNYGNRLGVKHYKIKYPTFAKVEEMREHYVTKEIQVHCKNHNCLNSKEKGGWFTPTKIKLYERIRQLEHPEGNGGSYLYCSDECKQECPLFHLQSDPNKEIKENKLNYTNEEYQIFREEVLKREEHICECCGNQANTVHHSRPQKLEPFFSLDPDFGVACCQTCHYKYGHKDECSTGKIASKICS